MTWKTAACINTATMALAIANLAVDVMAGHFAMAYFSTIGVGFAAFMSTYCWIGYAEFRKAEQRSAEVVLN